MRNTEKSILKGVYILTLLMFGTLSLTKSELNPIIFGFISCLLIAYANFIIRKFFYKGDKYLLVISSIIAQFGLVMIYRLNTYYAIKQITFFTLGMGIFIFLVVFLPDLKYFSKLKYIYLLLTIVLLSLPLIFGKEIKGSKNWILIGGFSMQPSEIAKFFFIMYLSSAFVKVENFKEVVFSAIASFLAMGILVLEKDLGAALIYFGIFITILYIGTSDLKLVFMGTSGFFLGGILSYFMFGHVRTRVAIWIDPFKDKLGKGHQICQSLFAIAAGGLFGTGINMGHPEYISVVMNDFIFAGICEEMGLLGGIALIILYLLLVYRGLRIAIHAVDDYSRLIAVGISSMIGFHVFVIIGGVIKMIPLTGITLPFVSYGGSSMLLNFICLGVLQKISEKGDEVIG